MTTDEKQHIEALVAQAQKGDEDAFASLYDLFFEKLFRYVSFRVSGEYIEDLVADIFLKIVQNLSKYRPKKDASFAAWVFRMAHNRIIDFYRKQKEILASDDPDTIETIFEYLPDHHHKTPEHELQHLMEAKRIQSYLQELRPTYREMLELKYFQDLSNKEISMITGKTEGNIRIIQLRALKELRKLFDGTET